MIPDLTNATDSCWTIERPVAEAPVDPSAATPEPDDQPRLVEAGAEVDTGCFGTTPRRDARRRDRAATRPARARAGRRRAAPRKED